MSSVSGLMGNRGQANYAAAKAGLIGAVKSLSLECAPRGVTVNAVAPGIIDSPAVAAAMTAASRSPRWCPRAGRAARRRWRTWSRFLASDRAGYITGQVIAVSGGLGLKRSSVRAVAHPVPGTAQRRPRCNRRRGPTRLSGAGAGTVQRLARCGSRAELLSQAAR